MNKKMILSLIIIALAAFIGIALYKAAGLKSIQIVKSVTIKGTKGEVFDMVRYLNNYPKWSPFLVQDPTQKYEVKGTDGTVGARYHWHGNKGKDLGYQEISKIDTFNFVGIKCIIQKPFVAEPTFDYTFKETANGIQVTQNFNVQSGSVDGLFMWLFGIRGKMEETNQQGLDLLKKAIEK